jgi:predicted oxidoreductase
MGSEKNESSVRLGRSDLRVGRLAYGCWRIAGAEGGGAVTPERRRAGIRAVLDAYELGYDFFDLADIYAGGVAEELFGEALKESAEMRGRVVVMSKCGIRFKGDPVVDAPYRYDFSAEHIMRSCEASLKRMGVDVLDVYLLHRPDYLGDPQEVAEAFARLEEQGKVRHFGVSNFSPSQVRVLQQACSRPLLANQIEIHLMRLDPFHDGTLDQCMEMGMTPLAWSPLAGGRLVDANPIDLHTRDHAHRIHVREVMDQVAKELEVSRTVVALAWLLRHPSGTIPIVGSTRKERMLEARQALGVAMTREQWYRLFEVSHGKRLP